MEVVNLLEIYSREASIEDVVKYLDNKYNYDSGSYELTTRERYGISDFLRRVGKHIGLTLPKTYRTGRNYKLIEYELRKRVVNFNQ